MVLAETYRQCKGEQKRAIMLLPLRGSLAKGTREQGQAGRHGGITRVSQYSSTHPNVAIEHASARGRGHDALVQLVGLTLQEDTCVCVCVCVCVRACV